MKRGWTWLALAVGLAAQSVSAGEPLLTRPDPEGTPTKVLAALYVNDIASISGAEQAVNVDFILRLRWKDPRFIGLPPRKLGLDEVWTPQARIVNERRIFKKLPEAVQVDSEGNVTLLQRYWGQISSPFRLHDFPLDEHTLRIEIVAAMRSVEEVEFVIEESVTGRAEKLSIPDWSVGAGTAETYTFDFLDGKRTFPGFAYVLPVARHTGFFLWKILLPLVLIVLMSWIVFWVDSEHAPPQVAVPITAMLTLIAYRFVIGGFIPNVPYLTRLDHFILGSTVLVFLALVQEVGATTLCRRVGAPAARRLDVVSRWAFPLLFGLIFVWAFLI